jgi:ferritin-like metal-binding protein YciE
MTVDNLHDKFVYELQQAYYLETELVDALGKMIDSTSDEKIREGFEKHQRETGDQARRLKTVFNAIDEEPEIRKCHALDGLIEDREEFLDNAAHDDDLVDLYNVGAGMKVERLEITTYEGLLTHADRLDLGSEVTDPLDDTLDEEKATLRELKGVAEGSKIQQLAGRLMG